uniref:SRP54-type proteins GTP-binding domain-containing protein n=1 Tax=Tetradesmus obliquus TaxID=3088 RepID=A0A383V6G1_TETOB|eukprot:jgi/Sobl393_1/12877/SZX60299.1
MLDYFAIFTKGGALLWTLQFTTALKHNPLDALNALIRTCLLEERSGDAAFTYAPKVGAQQALKWTFHNGLGLVFVAVYQKTLSLLYVEDLLAAIKDAFLQEYTPGSYSYPQFQDKFAQILRDCETRADKARTLAAQPTRAAPAAAAPAAKAGKAAGQAGSKAGSGAATPQQWSSEESGSDADADAAGSSGSAAGGSSSAAGSDEEAAANGDAAGGFNLAKLKGKGVRAAGPAGRRNTAAARRAVEEAKEKAAKEKAAQSSPAKPKSGRVWGGFGRKEEAVGRLDFTEGQAPGAAANGNGTAEDLGSSLIDAPEEEYEPVDDEPVGQAAANGNAAAPAKRGLLGSFVGKLALSVVGSSALSAADLAPALEDMKRRLMERNVAEEIAAQVVDSVAHSLEGQKLSSFTGVGQFVRRAFEDSLSGILNKRQVDVLHDIKRARARGKPYVVVFCGVNGVGKSTNLAKIAYWLGQHGCKVQLAACDTFRAGAVEQLKTHAMRLGVPLYERGYEKDPAKVAAEAIRVAQRDGRDVVLVDTAGRMQDNEPLMRALSNLISLNQPELVLFVGEALVGNDAVDQLVKFNRSLADLAPGAAAGGPAKRQVIDGIVLTKFDTIDDKVGAALSMVYASGAPVMFVGCGQTYVDLKKLNVRSVVNSLLK